MGFYIKKLREEKNISQEELAEELNISQSKLSKIENGHLNVSLPFILSAFNFFSLTLSDLVEVLQYI
ncbi:MAG: transcriptional regulator [Chryseobacterium sp.]|nr:MAG: transcriptional regulator [Chryseobacterium sp.]